jgi:hypothetical protein
MARKQFQWVNTDPTAPFIDSIVTDVTNPAPTLATQGISLSQRSDKVLITYATSGVAGVVSFRVWLFVPGAGWFLEDALGAAGTVTVGAVTDPQRGLIIEYPGARLYIEVMNTAVSTTSIAIYEGREF